MRDKKPNVQIEESWARLMSDSLHKPYFDQLITFIKREYACELCYPTYDRIFAAFDHCPVDKARVIIIGQDPYHGPGQANGLCFSVNDDMALPPSLRNIFKEVQNDLGLPVPLSGNLERWAEQGVLLLNATLSVRAHQAGSHQNKGWEIFTDEVISKLSKAKDGLVFLLWGSFAQKKLSIISSERHLILKSPHPSPLSAHRGFFGNRHFSQVNEWIKSHGEKPIEW